MHFCGEFRAVRRKQACFLSTHTHTYRRTQTHNPGAYCARVNIVWRTPVVHFALGFIVFSKDADHRPGHAKLQCIIVVQQSVKCT